MVLNRKGFFLELGDHQAKAPETKSEAKQEKAESAPESSQPAAAPAPAPVKEVAPAPVEEVAPAPVAVAAESKTDTTAESAEVESKAKPSLTTAEAIAAELAAAEAARPVVTLSTFAPDNLLPGNGLRQRKRRPGSNLKGFKEMAGDLFKS